ncbi:unnamed protein product [Caenorhabditis bovis]|uniref:Presequence protease, mitochondrial n=1 Tax=Caenorhabditis bovis TaxID=2654633 RepID=A0A8S1ERF3_9PELO|nr:unnamed protein product [Caenorhabditis bovis]
MSCSKLWNCSETIFNGGIKIFLYASTRTKLKVAVGEVPGPTVHGCVSFVTEADSDDGLPHTLEHLVFMGSKKYPFKGVLDIIANRCLADGTNAWTDIDHTAYTLNTVGSDGFLKVLPIYINHLLNPMLTESQFATEVHHIDGKGNDAGVVYSEMQDHESEMESIMDRKTKELIYPPLYPYAVDTGGRLKNLRESCTIEKVRAYHKKYYHLSNMVVTVCGKVDHSKLLQIMEDVEQEHMASVPEVFPRPFSIQPCEIKESIVEKVKCPSDDSSRGSVEITCVLFDYFTNTSVSPLQKDFVLIDDALASSAYFHVTEAVRCEIRLNFGGVPVEKLESVAPKFFDKTLREHLEPTNWDMERMGFLIDQTILNELVKLETSAQKDIAAHIIGHQLFDNNDTELLNKRFNEVEYLKKLKSEPATFWAELAKKYFTTPSATVIGVPDEALVNEIAQEEEKRIAAQRKKLGKDGLLQKKKEIEAAIKENTSQHPTHELLDKLMVKDLEDFDRFPVQSLTKDSAGLTSIQAKFLSQFPFDATLHNCPTKFVEATFLLDSADLTLEQRCLLLLYTDLLFECPAIVDGVQKTAEEVAKLSTKDLIDHSVQVGVSGYFDKLVNLKLKVGADKFHILSKWAQIFTQGIVFDASRIKMSAQRLASEAREKKRDGCSVSQTAITSLVYNQNSNSSLYDDIVLEKVHEKIAKEASKNPNAVIEKLEDVRRAVFKNGLNAHFVCDVELIDEKQMSPQLWQWSCDDQRFGSGNRIISLPGEDNSSVLGREYLIGVGGSESSFIIQTALMDAEWNSESLLPTMVFGQYLSQCEGPLWCAIRGTGLAYGANIYVKPDRQQITLSLYRCAKPSLAYEKTKEIVMDIVKNGNVSETEFEGAKRSLVFEMMKRESTVASAGKLSILSTFRNTPYPFNVDLCQRIWEMSSEEMVRLGGERIARLFEKQSFVRSIAVHPSKVKEMKESFPEIETINMSALQIPALSN